MADNPLILPEGVNESIRLEAGATDILGARGATHGEQGYGDTAHARWCAVHGWHGLFYKCPMYDETILGRVTVAKDKWARADEALYKELKARGAPPSLENFFRRLAAETNGKGMTPSGDDK